MRGACIRLSRMMPVPLRLPHNYTPVFFNTLHVYMSRDYTYDTIINKHASMHVSIHGLPSVVFNFHMQARAQDNQQDWSK